MTYTIETTERIIAYAIKYCTTAQKLKMAECVLKENNLTDDEREKITKCYRRLLKKAS